MTSGQLVSLLPGKLEVEAFANEQNFCPTE